MNCEDGSGSSLISESYDYKGMRGKKLKAFRRDILNLSRVAFSEKFALSTATLRNWEDNKNGGMNESAAQRLMTLFAKANIKNSPNLLMAIDIQAELDLLKENNPQEVTLDHRVTDNVMAPFANAGDLVAGIKCSLDDLLTTNNINEFCILQDDVDSPQYIALFNAKQRTASFSNSNKIISNIEPVLLAKIIWLRKK